jgi:hypothetical protein
LAVGLRRNDRELFTWTYKTALQRMNLIGFTSSLSDDLTKAYTERILSVEVKIFSSCVRSVNLIRIVVSNEM